MQYVKLFPMEHFAFKISHSAMTLGTVIINNQVLNKAKNVIKISSQKGHKYDESMMKI